MREKVITFLVELCCVYTLVSVGGAIVNMLIGGQTNNLNVLVMFMTCFIDTLVLNLHKLFDRVSPLLMIIIQYLVACVLCAVMILIVCWISGETVDPRGWYEFYRSFTIPYVILAGYYYYRVFSDTKKQDDLIQEIQKADREREDKDVIS